MYQAITLASATGISVLAIAISAACCFGAAANTARERHTTRVVGVKKQRTDKARRERREVDENLRDDALLPYTAQPSESVATGFSFKGLAGRYDAVNQ